jgi:hypothetical protein
LKVAIAILAASLGSSLVTTLWLALLSVATSDAQSDDAWFSFASWSGLTFLITALVASTIGLAWHAFAHARGWRSVHAYWLPATMVGVIPPALIVLAPALRGESWMAGSLSSGVVLSLCGASLGGLTGLFAWLIRRPDRDAANPATPAP